MTWDEYRVKFLASKGFNEKEMAEKIKNNEDLKVDEESKFTTHILFLFIACILYKIYINSNALVCPEDRFAYYCE